MTPPPHLPDELVEEVLLRLPPDEPARFVHLSAVCKPWRQILAAPRFRRRYNQFHGTPPVLGLFQKNGRFVPTCSLFPAQPDRTGSIALDCRHGRALFSTSNHRRQPSDLIVLDPATGRQRRVPSPDGGSRWFSAAVLCAAQGCDHHGCEEGHFLVVLISTDGQYGVASARVYSSETCAWSERVFLPEPSVMYGGNILHVHSVLVGDAVYFNGKCIFKYQLGTHRLSMFEKPTDGDGTLMTAEDGGLGFAAVMDATDLALWLRKTGPGRAAGWAKLRVIDLKRLLPNGIGRTLGALVSGFAEGTQVIVLRTYVGCYMVDLKSGRVMEVSYYTKNILPYMRFYIPAMKAACTGQGQ